MSASLRDEAVAGVVIVCPSSQQPCGCSTSVKRCGGATRRGWRRFPGHKRPFERSVAMRAVATKSLVIWPCACWSEGCFFGHWRSDVTFPLIAGGATRRTVRKHRAPKGALRLNERSEERKNRRSESTERQRCIKTSCGSGLPCSSSLVVRNHRAPKGALRRVHVNDVAD